MKDSKAEVEKIARLARLELAPGEHEKFARQFSSLLDHFSKIQELRTEGIEPMVYPFEARNVFREDREGEACDPEGLLRNAPERHEGFYKVPKVIEG